VLKFTILLFRYFIRLSYKGTHYNGWQIQPGVNTVQEMLNKKLSLLLKEEIYTVGAGRTDTGVHATCFYAHFDSENQFIDDHKETIIYHLNCILPRDISIYDFFKVNMGAHARFSALSRTYQYRIARIKNPFTIESAWYYHKPLDLKMMNIAAQVLFEYNDFTSFSKLHTDVKTNNCIIKEACWINQNEEFIFIIKADRFLRNMVRAIVGTLLMVGSGKMSVEKFRKVIEKRDRAAAGISVDARGLYLIDIEYPMEIYLK
jgi:tRNA pseudouridine38-40 synthase